MRTLIIAALSTTLIGCNCLMTPQAAVDGCVSPGCFDRLATVDPSTELRPAPFTPHRAAPNVKSARAAKTPKQTFVTAKSDQPPSVQERNPAALVEENPDAPTIIKPEAGATHKAKTTIAENGRSDIGFTFRNIRCSAEKSKAIDRCKNGGSGLCRVRGHEAGHKKKYIWAAH